MKKEHILSPALRQEIEALRIEALRSGSGTASPVRLRQDALMFERWKVFCQRALSETHLVAIASAILKNFDWDIQDMEAIGLPVDILDKFPDWRQGSTAGFRPGSRGLRLSSLSSGKQLGSLRLQLSPSSFTISYALILIRDLLRQLEPSVQLYIVVEPGANLQNLREVFQNLCAGAETRLHFAETRSVSIFAQDNALAACDDLGNPILMIPRTFRKGKAREEDELLPEEAERQFGLKVVRSQLYWEGGNIIHDGYCCLIGVDTIGENMVRLGLTEGEVLSLFEAEFVTKVVCLGDLSCFQFDVSQDMQTKSGQASFHIDLDVSLPGFFGHKRRPRALVADPARGLDFLPAVLAHRPLFTQHFLPANQARKLIEAEYEAFARERHPKLLDYSSTLEALGYMVFGVPDLRIDPKENIFKAVNLDFSYCNILPGLWHDRPAIHYLPWGIRTLDSGAEKQFQAAGVYPVRISSTPQVANELMKLCGGLHCFCGQLI